MIGVPLAPSAWYRIDGHPAFDDDFAYRALAYLNFGETAWAALLFTSDRGHTVAVQVHRCTALPPATDSIHPDARWRLLTAAERAFPRAGKFTNPDIGTDL